MAGILFYSVAAFLAKKSLDFIQLKKFLSLPKRASAEVHSEKPRTKKTLAIRKIAGMLMLKEMFKESSDVL